MKHIFLFTFIALTLTSCAGTLTHIHMLEDGGAIHTEKSNTPQYDYKVFIKNTRDFGWDGDRQEDREKAVNLLFSDKCKKIKILEDQPLQTGTYPINRPAVTWVMKIKCDN